MFLIDQQTYTDLNALKRGTKSLLDYFDQAFTIGGSDVLYDYFTHPLTDGNEIQKRQDAIRYLANEKLAPLFDKYMMNDLERYLRLPEELYSQRIVDYYRLKFSKNIWSLDYKVSQLHIRRSVMEIAQIILHLQELFGRIEQSGNSTGKLADLKSDFLHLTDFLDFTELQNVAEGQNKLRIIIKYDFLFRNSEKSRINQVLNIWYTIDALFSISRVLIDKSLVFPQVIQQDEGPLMNIKGLYNLTLDKPIKNDIEIANGKNIWFLTGANMTGKSTLLKSIGVCVYLAHLGLPVPARNMQFVPFDGLITTINLGDDLASGFSHFYNEVKRIKSVATRLNDQSKMVVIWDELFNGTNYQDAQEAIKKLINSFSGISDSVFIISNHITEVARSLEQNPQVDLKQLGVELDEKNGLRLTYELQAGVADQKLGMWFLDRERVFELFEKYKNKGKKGLG